MFLFEEVKLKDIALCKKLENHNGNKYPFKSPFQDYANHNSTSPSYSFQLTMTSQFFNGVIVDFIFQNVPHNADLYQRGPYSEYFL